MRCNVVFILWLIFSFNSTCYTWAKPPFEDIYFKAEIYLNKSRKLDNECKIAISEDDQASVMTGPVFKMPDCSVIPKAAHRLDKIIGGVKEEPKLVLLEFPDLTIHVSHVDSGRKIVLKWGVSYNPDIIPKESLHLQAVSLILLFLQKHNGYRDIFLKSQNQKIRFDKEFIDKANFEASYSMAFSDLELMDKGAGYIWALIRKSNAVNKVYAHLFDRTPDCGCHRVDDKVNFLVLRRILNQSIGTRLDDYSAPEVNIVFLDDSCEENYSLFYNKCWWMESFNNDSKTISDRKHLELHFKLDIFDHRKNNPEKNKLYKRRVEKRKCKSTEGMKDEPDCKVHRMNDYKKIKEESTLHREYMKHIFVKAQSDEKIKWMGKCRGNIPTLGNGLMQKQSTIPNAGNGLFTTIDFAEGSVVTCFEGLAEEVTQEDLNEIDKNFSVKGTHVINLAKQRVIRSPKVLKEGMFAGSLANDISFCRFVKDKAKEIKPNIKLVIENYNAFLVAKRDIKKGEELFFEYNRETINRSICAGIMPTPEESAKAWEAGYFCQYCKRRYTKLENLKSHVSFRHHNERTFYCEHCNKQFVRVSDVKKHVKAIHSSKEDVSFALETERKRGEAFLCQICKFTYGSGKALNYHYDTYHLDPKYCKYQCQVCGKQFPNKNILKVHCRDSGHSLSTTPNQKGSTSSEDSRECVEKIAIDKAIKKKEIKNKVPYSSTCKMCNFHTTSSFKMTLHRVTKHQLGKIHKCTHDGCGKEFKHSNYLRHHTLKAHAEKKFSCELCSKRYGLRTDLKRHIQDSHTHRVSYLCNHCGRFFFNEVGYHQHLLQHDKIFKCDVCEKVFGNKGGLASHKKIHDEKNTTVKCNICSKLFTNDNALKSHKVTHQEKSGEYRCEGCDKEFRAIGHYHVHVAAKNRICQVCNTEFVCSSMKKQHMKHHFKCYTCWKYYASKKEKQICANSHIKCSSCKMVFDSEKALKEHREEKHSHYYSKRYQAQKLDYSHRKR